MSIAPASAPPRSSFGKLPLLSRSIIFSKSYIFPPVSAAIETSAGGGSGSGGVPSRYGILTRTLDLRLAYRVHHGSCDVELAVTNRWNEHAQFEIEWLLDADYAAMAATSTSRRL